MAILDFQKPEKVIMLESSDNRGQFEFRPLEPGYGITVGNALRRVLLNSLEGFAVTAVKIEGVDHEFSTIKGVVEDVTQIILNLKQVKLKVNGDAPEKRLFLKAEKPGKIFVKDIEADADVELLNPDFQIATLDEEGKLDMEMIVKPGRGYVPAERNKEEGLPIGVVPVDSIFSPIKYINYCCLLQVQIIGNWQFYSLFLLYP